MKSIPVIGESSKAFERRLREGWFFLYANGKGIDIGCGPDPLTPTCDRWDKPQGDAQLMAGVPDNHYDWVYSSHALEHMDNPTLALTNWWRILKSGGHLIIVVPARDLYEKRTEPPSIFNPDHKTFWVPGNNESPTTPGLFQTVQTTLGESSNIISLRTLDDGFQSVSTNIHSNGEYSYELIAIKTPPALTQA